MADPTKVVRGGLNAVRMASKAADQAMEAKRLAQEAAKADVERSLPLVLARAPAKSQAEINAAAERVGRQMLGEHVSSGKAGDTTNLAGRSRKENQRVKGLQYELTPTKNLTPSQVVQPQVGDINVAFPGDYTLSDVELKSLQSVPINAKLEGGSRYGLGKTDMDDPLFWASGEGPAQQAQDKITDVASLYNPDRVMAQHLAMGPVATNFAQHFADANLRAIDYSKMSKKDMDTFDRAVAGGYDKTNRKTGETKSITFPNWPGIANPEAAYAAMKADPELRKWFNARMKTPELTQATNMPNGLDVQWAITNPDLRNMEVNLTGHSVGEMIPGAALTDTADHNTYSKGIQGLYKGNQEVLSPFAISYPDAAQHIASTQRPQDFTGTIQKVFPHQLVDQQYIDELGQYSERLKRMLTGKKEGGAVERKESPEDMAQFNQLLVFHKATGGKMTFPTLDKADGGKIAKGLMGAINKAGKAADAAIAARKVEAPSIIIPSKVSNVKEAVRQSKGDYGARRVERAADEIPNLERLYKEEALKQAFQGDNAKPLMTINPKDFENYAMGLPTRTVTEPRSFGDKTRMSTEDYLKYLRTLPEGFDDVPFLEINKQEQGLPLMPFISAHEGRHRNRAMAEGGEKAGLVRLFPRAELREGFPRRSQEEYIEALKKELEMTGNLVLPEHNRYNSTDVQRPAIKLPDIYAKGGGVHMVDGGDPLDQFSPPRYRSAGRRPESQNDRRAAANMPVDFARGVVSGIGGAPGDIESLIRMLPGLDEKTVLPTSEDIENRLPFKSDTPAGRAASGLGTLAGGFYSGPGAPIRLVGGLPQAVYKAGKDFGRAAGQPATNVVKPTGGNFLTGRTEKDLQPLKRNVTTRAIENGRYTPEQIAQLAESPRVQANDALNNWVDSNLTNYVKKQMGTADDPVRKLAERGITHKPALLDEYLNDPLSGEQMRRAESIKKQRMEAGFPEEGLGQSPMAKAWELASDESIAAHRAGDIQGMPEKYAKFKEVKNKLNLAKEELDEKFLKHIENSGLNDREKARFMRVYTDMDKAVLLDDDNYKNLHHEYLSLDIPMMDNYTELARQNPYINKLDPETPMYAPFTGDLGFDHIMDVLREDVTAGRIRPEQLSKVSMEQAVRRTYEYDQELAAKMNASRAAAREGLPTYREYPEGYKWIQLNKPGAFSQESEAMGHSVRGYEPPKGHPDWVEGSGDAGSPSYGHGGWEAIKSGKAKVYSLVDSKGAPHTTVEVRVNQTPSLSEMKPYMAAAEDEAKNLSNGYVQSDVLNIARRMATEGMPPRITQIKGKGNRAPSDEYLPYVQNFVKGGQWAGVDDLRNTGLRRTSDALNSNELKMIQDAGLEVPTWASGEDLQRLHNSITPEGQRLKYDSQGQVVGQEQEYLDPTQYAHGGAVRMARGGEVHMAGGGDSKDKSFGERLFKKFEHLPKVKPPSPFSPLDVAYGLYKYKTGTFPIENWYSDLEFRTKHRPMDTGSVPVGTQFNPSDFDSSELNKKLEPVQRRAKGGAVGQESPEDIARFNKLLAMHKAIGGIVKKFDDGGAAFGIYPKAKGGEDLRSGGEYAGEFAKALGKITKDQGSEEMSSLKKPRAVTDLLNRGVLANNPLSAMVDLVNMGLVPLDVLGSKLTGRDIKVSSDKPFLGSEYVKDLMNKYNVTSGEERPMMETALSFASPAAMIKGAMVAPKAAQKAGNALKDLVKAKKARGGLTLMR